MILLTQYIQGKTSSMFSEVSSIGFKDILLHKETAIWKSSSIPPPSEEDIWECNAATMEECLIAFLDARIFDGKTFWEVESEIEWVDD